MPCQELVEKQGQHPDASMRCTECPGASLASRVAYSERTAV